MSGDGAPDPLRAVLQQLADALRPFGIRVLPGTLLMWRHLQERGAAPFTAAGELDPGAVAALERAVAALRALTTADPTETTPGT